MNSYGNQFGFHTPELSLETSRKLIEALKGDFEDSSWHNDLADSISSNSMGIKIFLPNSTDQHDEESYWTNYTVVYEDWTDESFSNPAEVIRKIKSLR